MTTMAKTRIFLARTPLILALMSVMALAHASDTASAPQTTSLAPVHVEGESLDGYHRQRPLSRDDRQLLASLLPLVHVDFALSEVEYFQGITQSPANADVAWDTFLRGHAAWFGTPAGQALLQAIRDCT
jgi:hypothetical protein